MKKFRELTLFVSQISPLGGPLKGPETCLRICLFENVSLSSSIAFFIVLMPILITEGYTVVILVLFSFPSFYSHIATTEAFLKTSSIHASFLLSLHKRVFKLLSGVPIHYGEISCCEWAEEACSSCVSNDSVLVTSQPFLVLEQVCKLFISFHR